MCWITQNYSKVSQNDSPKRLWLGLKKMRRWSLEKRNTSDFPCFPVDGAQAVAVGGECLSVCCRDNEKTEKWQRGCFPTWFVFLQFENPWISYHSAVFLRRFFLILQLKMCLTWADRLLRSFSSSSPYDKRVKTQLVADVPGMPRHISYGTSRWLSWKTATDMRSEVKEISEKTSGLSLHSLKRGRFPFYHAMQEFFCSQVHVDRFDALWPRCGRQSL